MNYLRLALNRMDTIGHSRCRPEFVIRNNGRSVHLTLIGYGQAWSCETHGMVAYSRTPSAKGFNHSTGFNFGYVADKLVQYKPWGVEDEL